MELPLIRQSPPRARAVLVVFALLLVLMPAQVLFSAQSHAADPLISQGKPVATSSNETGALNGPKAVDGNATTRWASAEGSDPQWIRVDLGSGAQLSQVKLLWESAYARAYTIQVSGDGTTWSTIYSTTTGDGGTDDLAVTGSGRYVRMHGTQRGTAYGYSLFEFQVFGTVGGGTPDTIAPTVPANLRSTGTTSTSVSLAWDASTDNVGVTGYEVFQGDASAATVTGTTATVSGLTANTAYRFRVRARDAAGNLSGFSAEITVTTPGGGTPDTIAPTVPANLRSTGTTSTSVSLAWNASTDNVGVTGYEVFQGDASAATVTGTTATVSGLTANTAYRFRVRARDAAGNLSAFSTEITVTTAGTNPGTTPVAINGQLRVCGVKLCNQYGNPIQLRGMSTHGLQWYENCVNDNSLTALATDWNADVVRLSMYIQEGGYETNPRRFTDLMHSLIEKVTARGMYVIVDWHQLSPGDPNANLSRARTFFTEIAQRHGNKPNILYDVANEPNNVSWARVRAYHEAIIPVVRAQDPDSVILLGTHGWGSLGVSDGGNENDVINNPVRATNILYTFHFYAGSHGTNYLNTLSRAADRIPMFVTEFGTQTASGDGANNFGRSQQYIDLMAQKKISWVNWNFSDDSRSGAVFTGGTCPGGPFAGTSRLKPAGVWVRDRIRTPDNFPTN